MPHLIETTFCSKSSLLEALEHHSSNKKSVYNYLKNIMNGKPTIFKVSFLAEQHDYAARSTTMPAPKSWSLHNQY